MSADADRYAAVARGFTDRLSGVGPDQWSSATPSCPEWTVRDLVAHTIRTQRYVLASLGSEAIEVDPEGDLMAQWSEATAAVSAAASDPDIAATLVDGVGAKIPFGSLVGGVCCSDTVIHTWDLARATGQAEDLDPEAVVHCEAVLASFGDAMRRPGGFDDPLPCADDADPQTKFLLFTGRTV